MIIRQYRPAFFEGFETEECSFETVEELFQIPWIENFTKRDDFHQFSRADEMLMAEYKEGKEWWVVGRFLGNPDEIDLPKWEPKE